MKNIELDKNYEIILRNIILIKKFGKMFEENNLRLKIIQSFSFTQDNTTYFYGDTTFNKNVIIFLSDKFNIYIYINKEIKCFHFIQKINDKYNIVRCKSIKKLIEITKQKLKIIK